MPLYAWNFQEKLLELLDVLPGMTLLVLEASELSPCLIFGILGIGLLFKLPLELTPCVDEIGSSTDVVTPMTPPNKSNIFR